MDNTTTHIISLIPVGRNSAIKRNELVKRCIEHGLVDDNANADRQMRLLIKQARIDFVILNLSDGNGYYRPALDDAQDLQKYIRQEEKRAKQTFKNISLARKLYEDYAHGRIKSAAEQPC